MNSLKELDAEVMMAVPEEAGKALKALALGVAGPEQQKTAYRFIVKDLAGVDRLSFAMPGDVHAMAWFAGRRFVGLQMETIVATPIEVPQTVPPARTMTERARRKGEGK